MRPLRYSINLTLDGCCDHRAIPPDEELHRHHATNLERADALLLGRVTYEMMEAAWRQPATGTWPAWVADWMIPFARTIDGAKKYVVSSTLDRVDWNAELVQGDLGTAVRELKGEPGRGLLVGGVTLPLALADLGLIDEYEFVVHPILAGHGPTLFAGLSERARAEPRGAPGVTGGGDRSALPAQSPRVEGRQPVGTRARQLRHNPEVVAVAYDPTIYQGAAVHYRQGRPPYSPQLESVLGGELRLDGSRRLLDVGCGPGVLAVRLAHLFEEAVGLDPDAAMLAEAQRAAAERGVTNVRWVEAVAEDLPGVAPGPYRLVTFGQSFHWTDEPRVAEAVYDMLEPPGAIALIVDRVDGRPRPSSPGPPPIPHDEIDALVQRYLGSNRRAGRGTGPSRAHRFEDVLARTRFGPPQSIFVPGVPDLVRDTESVLAGYFSFSSSAPHLFGDRVEDFAADMRELLASRSAEGLFWDWPGDTEVIIARRRG